MNNEKLYDEYAQLAARIKSGDENAFTDLYNKSERLVYATCYGILRDPDDAADATQDTYVAVFNKIGSFEDDRMLLGWIKTIAANKALDLYRKKKGDVSYDDTIASDESLQGNDDLESLPDSYILVEEKRNILRKILREELSDVQYQTVILYYYDELPVETIAQLMNCPEGTVKTRLKSSRVKIRSGIEKYEKDNDDRFAAAAVLPFMTKFLNGEADNLTLPAININSMAKSYETASKEGPGSKENALGSKEGAGAKERNVTGAKDSAWTAPKAKAKEGFFSTVAGKVTIGVLALAAVVGITATVISIAVNDKDEDESETTTEETYEDMTETDLTGIDTEHVATTETTAAEETDATSGTEEVTPDYVEPVVEGEAISMSIDELPEAEQLRVFVDLFQMNGYDCNTGFEAYHLGWFLPNSTLTETVIDYSQYFDDFEAEKVTADPNGTILATSSMYRLEAEKLYWIEENIFNLSTEKMDVLNSSLTDGSDTDHHYLAGDGYIYYSKGDAGGGDGNEIVEIFFDGEYYYVKTQKYYFDEPLDCVYYTMKLKLIDGRYYWSVIKVSDTDPLEASNEPASVGSDIEVGDIVAFGRYEQDNDPDNGAEPIKWQVLDIQDGRALLISKYVLDYECFNESENASGSDLSVSQPWNSSYIRTWLNSEFSGSAFTDEESGALADMTDYTQVNDAGEFTGDIISGVFLLSYDDVMRYYEAVPIDYDEDHHDIYSMLLLCRATPYAEHNTTGLVDDFTQKRYEELTGYGFVYDESVIGNEYACWWLRSSFDVESWFTAEGHAMLVEQDGRIDLSRFGLFNEKDRQRGIRPCVWVDLDQAGDLLTETDGSDEEWMIKVEEEINCSWEIDGTRLIITGDKIPGDWEDESVPWYDSASTITEVEINGIEKIPNDLFDGLDSLQRIILGDATTDMKHRAFEDLPEGVVIVYHGQEYTPETIEEVLD